MNRDFQDFLRALNVAEAEFMVVGAYALAVHGRPRATGDIDIWIRPSAENAQRVYSALVSFGAPIGNLSQTDLTTPHIVYQMGVPPRRIDILTSVSGVDFARAWERRISVGFGGVICPVIGLADLIENKRATGRPKDLVDVSDLENIDPAGQ